MWPVTRQIVEGGQLRQASEVFRSIYDLAALRVECIASLKSYDALLTPPRANTLPLRNWRPIRLDPTMIWASTRTMNLLDLCGLAVTGLTY